jgi:hypothetical protein
MPETWLFAVTAGYMTRRLYGYSPTGLNDRLARIRDDMRLRLGVAAKDARNGVRDFLRAIHREDLMALFPPAGRALEPQLQACVRILDRIAQDQNRTLWLEKSPLHLGYIDLIERVIPQARFVHLVREGPDVIASMYEATQRYADQWRRIYPTLDRCIDQWNHCVKLSSKYVHHSRHILVRYEDVVSDPEAALRRLCHFADVEFEAQMLTSYARTADQLMLEQEQWKISVRGPVRNANGTKFRLLFDEEQKRHILGRLIGLPASMRCLYETRLLRVSGDLPIGNDHHDPAG